MKPQKPDKTPAWALALLAAIIIPEAARSKESAKRGEAVRRAQQLDEVPMLLNPRNSNDLSITELGSMLRDDSQKRDALRKLWGLSPNLRAVSVRASRKGNLAFEDAIEEEWCLHKTRSRLVRFMEKAGYPKDFISLDEITGKAYQRATGINDRAKRSRDAERKATARKSSPRAKQAKSSADKIDQLADV